MESGSDHGTDDHHSGKDIDLFPSDFVGKLAANQGTENTEGCGEGNNISRGHFTVTQMTGEKQ